MTSDINDIRVREGDVVPSSGVFVPDSHYTQLTQAWDERNALEQALKDCQRVDCSNTGKCIGRELEFGMGGVIAGALLTAVSIALLAR